MSQTDWQTTLAQKFGRDLPPPSPSETVMPESMAMEVIRRTPLYEGGAIVQFTLSEKTRLIDSKHVGVPYLQAIAGVGGGRVYIYVYADDVRDIVVGRSLKIIGRIKVFERQTRGGRVTQYIDFDRMPDDTTPTHRLCIHASVPETINAYAAFTSNVPETSGLIEIRNIPVPQPTD